MRSGIAGLWPVLTPLLLVACSSNSSRDVAKTNASVGFQAVPTVQPTAAGAWVVDPSDPLTLYALGHRSMRSLDGGHTWSLLDWPADARALWFTRKPAPALYLQVANDPDLSEFRLLESLDGGDHWQEVGTAPLGVTLIDGDTGPVLLTGAYGSAISRSTDNGATWADSTLVLGEGALPPELGAIVASTGPDEAVYVAALNLGSFGLEPAVLVSTDAGATFVAKPAASATSLNSEIPRLSLDCQGRVYARVGNTVMRSSDAATTWQSVADLDSGTHDFYAAAAPASTCRDAIYASGSEQSLWQLDGAGGVVSQTLPEVGTLSDLGHDRLLVVSDIALKQRSDDGGSSWWTAGVTLNDEGLAVSPAREGLLFDAAWQGVLRSDDDGRSWQATSGQVPNESGALYADAVDPDVLYARTIYAREGTQSTAYSFISTDGGASFQPWPVPTADQPERLVTIQPETSGTVLVVTESGVYGTADRGAHFTTLLGMPGSKRVLWATIGSAEPHAIYAYASDGSGDAEANAVFASTDGGTTWTSADPGSVVSSFAISPLDPRIALGTNVGSNGSGILRTLDGGNSWQDIAAPSNESNVRVGFERTAPYALHASGQHEYRSLDEGDTWQTLPETAIGVHLPNADDFASDPYVGGALYSLTNGVLEKYSE